MSAAAVLVAEKQQTLCEIDLDFGRRTDTHTHNKGNSRFTRKFTIRNWPAQIEWAIAERFRLSNSYAFSVLFLILFTHCGSFL